MLWFWSLKSPGYGNHCLALALHNCVVPLEIKETISATVVPTSVHDLERKVRFGQGALHILNPLQYLYL